MHDARDELRGGLDLRAAALAFLAPLLLALLHQHELCGATCRPLAIDAFSTTHVDGWLRGHAAASQLAGGTRKWPSRASSRRSTPDSASIRC